MMVFWEQRLVILATPKTGSTALESALAPHASLVTQRPPDLKHTPAYRYRRFVAPWLEKTAGHPFEVVAVMREPVDWLGSWYRFRQRTSVPPPKNSTAGMTFDDFVEGYLAKPRPAFADVGAMSRFLYHEKQLAVDRLFDYANPAPFHNFLEARLNMQIVLARENVSPAIPLSLSPALHDRLKQACPIDFALYESVQRGETSSTVR